MSNAAASHSLFCVYLVLPDGLEWAGTFADADAAEDHAELERRLADAATSTRVRRVVVRRAR